MNKQKREEDFLDAIAQSVARVLEKKTVQVSMDMLFKSDLGLSSLDVVEVGYELEQITGLHVRIGDIFLAQEEKGIQRIQDIYIKDIAQYLVQLSEKNES